MIEYDHYYYKSVEFAELGPKMDHNAGLSKRVTVERLIRTINKSTNSRESIREGVVVSLF